MSPLNFRFELTSSCLTWRVTWLVLCVLGACTLLPQSASAQPRWIITDFASREVEPSTVATFHDLLRDEIQIRNGATFGTVAKVCEDTQCARDAARGTGASRAVQGSIHRLGQKLIVSVSVVEVGSGQVEFSQRLSIDRVEELDIAAKRMAEALVNDGDVNENAELGTVTNQEAKNPTRRDTRFAGLLAIQGIAPTAGYADRQLGAGIGLGMFIETMDFIIEPFIAYRFDMTSDENDFHHLSFDLALAYLFSRSDIAPLAGLGLGLHYLNEDVRVERSSGAVLRAVSSDHIEDSLVGFSLFPRVGILFLRTYDVSLEVTLDYALTFADFQERSVEHALRLSMTMVFGGS